MAIWVIAIIQEIVWSNGNDGERRKQCESDGKTIEEQRKGEIRIESDEKCLIPNTMRKHYENGTRWKARGQRGESILIAMRKQ